MSKCFHFIVEHTTVCPNLGLAIRIMQGTFIYRCKISLCGLALAFTNLYLSSVDLTYFLWSVMSLTYRLKNVTPANIQTCEQDSISYFKSLELLGLFIRLAYHTKQIPHCTNPLMLQPANFCQI